MTQSPRTLDGRVAIITGARQRSQDGLLRCRLLHTRPALRTFGGSGYTTNVGLLEPYLPTWLFRSVPVSRELGLNQIAMEALGLPRS